MIFTDNRLKLVEERLAPLKPPRRQIGRQAANGDVAVGESGPTGLLEEIEDFLPLAKGVQKRAECPEIEPVRSHAD